MICTHSLIVVFSDYGLRLKFVVMFCGKKFEAGNVPGIGESVLMFCVHFVNLPMFVSFTLAYCDSFTVVYCTIFILAIMDIVDAK